MKKICAFIALMLFGFVLVACTNDPTPNPSPLPGEQTEAGITLPSPTLSINVGEKLDLLNGVTAIGYQNDDLTAEVKVNHNIPLDANGCVTSAGSYNVRYSLSINGSVVAQVFRQVTVIYVRPVTDDIIANGDFETGSVDPYTLGLFDGGNASLSVVEKDGSKALKVDVTGVSWQQASPRVQQEIVLDGSKIYEVSFKAAADEARTMHVQLGELLDGDPWFVDIDPTKRYFDLTTSMTEYSFRFKPAKDSGADMNKINILFELGTMAQGGSAQTPVYLDDIKVVEVDSLGADTIAPTITITGKTKYFVGSAFNAMSCVTVSDDQDENPTLTIVEAESSMPAVDAEGKVTTAGSYKVVYEAVDATGNKSRAEYVFDVVEAPNAQAEIIVNNTFADSTATGLTGWLDWEKSGISGVSENGKVTLTVNNSASAETWTNQFKQENLQIQPGKDYVLKITLKSSVTRNVIVAIQNTDWWNMHCEQKVELQAGVEQSLEIPFTAVDCSNNVVFFVALGNVDGTCPDTHTVEVSGLSLKGVASSEDSNLLVNADFSNQVAEAEGFGNWIVYGHNDGQCKLTWAVVDGKVVLTVNNAAATDTWHNQFKQNDLPLIEGKNYTLKVTLKSSVDRKAIVAIQNDKWWNMHTEATIDLVAGVSYEYSVDFTAVATSDNVMFFVALGKVGGTVIAEDHTVEISGLSLTEATGPIADTKAPEISVIGSTSVYVGDALDLNALVSAKDLVDGDVAATIVEAESTMPEIVDGKVVASGTYTVVYTAVDAAGNVAKQTVTINVYEKVESDNLFGTPSSEIAVGSGATEAICGGTTNKFHVFFNDQGWEGAPTLGSATYVDGKITITTTQIGTWWGTQVFYNTLPIAAGDYTISFKLVSPVSGNIKFAGSEPHAIVAGENTLSADFTLEAQSSYMVSIQIGSEFSGGALPTGTYVLSDFSIVAKEGGSEVDPTPDPDKAPYGKVVGVVVTPVAEGYCVAFAPIEGCAKYFVEVKKGDAIVLEQEIANGGTIALSEAGSYSVRVKALGDDTHSNGEYSDAVVVEVAGSTEPTPTPNPDKVPFGKVVGLVVNPVAQGYAVAFAPVAEASQYYVVVSKDGAVVLEKAIGNGEVISIPGSGTYQVKVKALGDATHSDGEYSDTVNLVIAGADDVITLATPVGVVCNKIAEGYVVAFAVVPNAVSYHVLVTGTSGVVLDQAITNGGVIQLAAGTYQVKVKAVGNGANISDSNWSDVITVVVA